MIGYTCKYTPLELFAAFGCSCTLLNSEAADFEYAETLTHNHFCCHAKAVLEDSRSAALEGLVLVNCCDSLRRTYDVARSAHPERFTFLLDLPHHDDSCARMQLSRELRRLAEEFAAYSGRTFDAAQFKAAFVSAPPLPQEPFLAVLGARAGSTMLDAFRAHAPIPVVDMTCGGNRRITAPAQFPDTFDALMDWYAGALLGQLPCMRMDGIGRREELLSHPNIKGIIYHSENFCDNYAYEEEQLRKTCAIPLLKLESDFSRAAAGQLATRLDAFIERIFPDAAAHGTNQTGNYVAGIDSGSTTTNVAVLDLDGNLVASAIVRTGPKAGVGAEKAFAAIAGFSKEDMAAIVATGYGRNNIPFATGAVTEITCHARGAHYLNPAARTIVDIGGQDSKVICLGPDGTVTNFVMNDKCAAGTGRFLELMARTMEVELDALGELGLQWTEDLTISSICTVFAESEVVSLIADNHSAADIVHGLHKSVAVKTSALVSRAGGGPDYMMTGGVARNRGVVKEIETRLGAPLWIAEVPDLCGALGAALFALEHVKGQRPYAESDANSRSASPAESAEKQNRPSLS